MVYAFVLILIGMAIGFLQLAMIIGAGHVVIDGIIRLWERRKIEREQMRNGL